jgi:hypothetical protein
MNSIINLTSTDANKSTVVVHKDGADFNVPIVNMVQTSTYPGADFYQYSAFITSTPSGITVNKVIKNTIGTVNFSRTDEGSYTINFPNLPQKEALWDISKLTLTSNNVLYTINIDGNSYISMQNLYILVTNYDTSLAADDAFSFFLLEVKVTNSN